MLRRGPAMLLLACLFAVRPAAAEVSSAWRTLDARLDRAYLVHLYTYRVNQPHDAWSLLQARLAHALPDDAIDLEAWRRLPETARAARRRRADALREELARATRELDRMDDASLVPHLRAAEPSVLVTGGAELFVDVLAALVGITALVPDDADAWYDLAFVAGCLGDTERQDAALAAFEQRAPPDRRDLRIRALLDRAWLARERGDADAAVAHGLAARALMPDGRAADVALSREARLVAALARADQGRTGEARSLAAPLDDLPYHERNRQAFHANPWLTAWRIDAQIDVLRRRRARSSRVHRAPELEAPGPTEAWTAGTSDWARDWVHAVAWAREGDPEQGLAVVGPPDARIEYPAGLGWRFWNDRGRLHEQAGQLAAARRCYALAVIHRPFFLYYPVEGRRGRAQLHQPDPSTHTSFVGCGRFYLAGDLLAYGAGCLLAWEYAAPDDPDRDDLQRRAEAALTTCVRRGIRPASALAQRGRLRYLTGDLARAATDLQAAHAAFAARGVEDPDLVLTLGLVHFNGEDYAGAVPWLEAFCRLRPEVGVGWRALGLAAAHSGLLPAAETALTRAVDVEPGHPGGRYNRALVRIQRGDRAGALADLQAAVVLGSGTPDLGRLLDAVRAGPLPRLSLQRDPIVLRATASALVPRAGPGLLGDLVAPAPPAPADDTPLATLEDVYLHAPTASNRSRLAQARLRAGDVESVRTLLAPAWDAGLSVPDMETLLAADRACRDAARARSLVLALQGGRPPPAAPALWQLVGVVCLESDLPGLAARAFAHAEKLLEANDDAP